VATELDNLLAELDRLRASVLRKVAGLSDGDARWSTVPSGTNLAGLVQHLTFVESFWFGEVVGGRPTDTGKRSMQVGPNVSLSQLRAEYRDACRTSNEIVASIGDCDVRTIHRGRQRDLRSVIVSVLSETARHAGHADIIREQIDGRTGR
jgi:hypothetical protein